MSLAITLTRSPSHLGQQDFSSDHAWMKYAGALESTQKLLVEEHAKSVADGSHAAERESLSRFMQAN